MAFKLNIGKDGSGSTGFGKSSSEVMAKCKSMATYMGTLQDNITGGVDGGAGTPGGFSGNYGSGMNMNDSGMSPALKKPKKDEFGTEIPEGFVDDSGRGGVTGTLKEFDSSDYKRGGKPAEVGQKRTDGGEVLDDYRDSKGKKKVGKAGAIRVKGVKFS